MYHLWRNEMYRLGDNAPKSYVVHRRLTDVGGVEDNDLVAAVTCLLGGP